MTHDRQSTSTRARATSRWAVILAMAAAVGGLVLAPLADARSRVRHLAFAAVAAMRVQADGPHVLLGDRTLIDERTNAQTSITPPPGCVALTIGGPWIAANCGLGSRTPLDIAPRPALYSISAGTWTSVALAPSIAAFCANAENCGIRSVGRHWLGIYEQSFGGSQIVFQNLTSGQVRPDPTAATTLPDLDAATLAQTVCSPLRVPPSTEVGHDPTPGSLIFAGRFAVATTSSLPSTTYVRRCGSRSRTFVCHCNPGMVGNLRSVAINAHVVIWVPPTPEGAPLGTAVTHLDGMYLPDRQRFIIPLPPAARGRGSEALLLTSRSLYIQNSSDGSRLFRARSPR
jgi:hypothetical protein